MTSFGPRTYLIGQLLPEMLRQKPTAEDFEIADQVVDLVDAVLDRMAFEKRLVKDTKSE